MTSQAILILIEKYFEGETSLQEERQIKAYFAQDEVAAEAKKYAPYFAVLKAEKEVRLPTKQVSFFKRNRYLVAASIVLLLGVFTFVGNQYTSGIGAPKVAQNDSDTCETPEQAALEIKAALALVSRKMRKSKRTAKKGLIKTRLVKILK